MIHFFYIIYGSGMEREALMVNEEKVRIMTRLASMEKGAGKDVIKEGGYYKADYIRSHVLVSVWSYTVGYILILALGALYHLEYLISEAGVAVYRNLAWMAGTIYVLILFGCIFFTTLISSARYTRQQKKQKEYLYELKQLEAFYAQNKEGGNG